MNHDLLFFQTLPCPNILNVWVKKKGDRSPLFSKVMVTKFLLDYNLFDYTGAFSCYFQHVHTFAPI
jgi:hypothetical protein